MLPDSHIHPVLFFDGVCNLCNNTVQFILKHDKRAVFRFASLQSVAGKAALDKISENIPADSVLLWYKNRFYTKSDAVLQTVKLLGGVWQLMLAGYLLPKIVRDKLYDMIAANRYRWFGKRETCMLPDPQLGNRFLG